MRSKTAFRTCKGIVEYLEEKLSMPGKIYVNIRSDDWLCIVYVNNSGTLSLKKFRTYAVYDVKKKEIDKIADEIKEEVGE